ncbi:MAG: TRAP transporter small permease [Syntrophobacterales bacterium]|jgi:TRAP-type C4-dicarboxylate transport system permease small subunit|nr:TRAP transporter small permease [Syntrophobacterales bacterium]
MEGIFSIVERFSKWMQVIACIALTFIMLLTVTDVVLRLFGHPIVGTFEMVGLGGAVAIGFAIPITSWTRGHIFVDFFYQKCPKGIQNILNSLTRLMGIILFFLIGWNLFKVAFELYKSGEVTLTRQLPFYPIAYGLGICCLFQCLVLICDIFKIIGGKYE